ncbi:MAG: sulfurtransferase TusA family protein [Oscillibacter sp.]
MTIKVNAMGDACPIPVVKTQKAMQELTGAGTVETLVDNETAVQNSASWPQARAARPKPKSSAKTSTA